MVKAVVGANWGDEGKGKITDMLAQDADVFSIIDFYLKVCNEIAISGADVTGREWVDCGKPEALAKAAQLTSNNL